MRAAAEMFFGCLNRGYRTRSMDRLRKKPDARNLF